MERCPPEILHKIFGLLDFDGISALRVTGQKFAVIGVEYLTTRIRFHCTSDSIKRAQDLAKHEVIKNHITSLLMYGNVLADVGCEHSYAAHYDLDHHSDEKPQPPPENCSNRERRLYERNLAKFDREVQQKYRDYRNAYKDQQQLLKGRVYSQIGRDITLTLPKLEHITLSTVGRCRHALSERFMKDFALSCAMPMDQNSEHSVNQLKQLLVPTGKPLQNLKSMDVHVLSPSFFTSTAPHLREVFSSLRRLSLTFRLSNAERDELHDFGAVHCYGNLSNGRLHNALTAAKDLEHLVINFDDYGWYGPAINVKTVLGENAWPNLKFLDLDTIIADEDYFTSALKRQPALQNFALGFATLNAGTWASTIKSLSKLGLKTFYAAGMYEDPGDIFPMHHVDVDAWMDERLEISMAELVEWYVTEPPEGEQLYNPLEDIVFDDPEELRLEYGSLSEDPDSDMSDSDEEEDEDSEDSKMPDLTDMDCD